MDDLRAELDTITDERELAFVMARSRYTKDKPAYEEAGYSRSVWYDKPNERRDYLVDVALQLKRQRTIAALMQLDRNAEQAAQVLTDLLQSEKDSVKLRAAQDILDRTTGRPVQKQEIGGTGPDGALRLIIEQVDRRATHQEPDGDQDTDPEATAL